MRTFVHIFFDNCFILFYFVRSETLTQAHACARALVANQSIGDKFCWFWWSCARAATGSRLPGVCCFLFYFVLDARTRDSPCLVLSCLTGNTFCQGAHICPQQLARPWQTTSPWPSCSWPNPSLGEPWRALVFPVVSMWETVQLYGSVGLIDDLLFLCDFFK